MVDIAQNGWNQLITVTRLKASVERQSLGSSSAIQLMIGLTLHGYRAGYHLRLAK